MSVRQKMIDDGMSDALADFLSSPSQEHNPFELITRCVLKKVPDATSADFQRAAQRWIGENRGFANLIVDLALNFAVPEQPNESIREIFKRAHASGSNEAKILLDWFIKDP
jgi:hypothetical protein